MPIRQEVDDYDGERMRSRAKRRHNSSSDSSLLEPAVTPKRPSWILEERNGKSQVSREETSFPPSQKKRKVATSTVESSMSPIIPQETFEKRARHKTREDLYDPKRKRKRGNKNDEEKKLVTKRTKKGDGKKAAKKAGEDLMNNFTSKSIGQDRLTVSHYLASQTLYNNAKAFRSGPLMALVFLKMAALPLLLNDVDVGLYVLE